MSNVEQFRNEYMQAASTKERMQVAKKYAEKPKMLPITKRLSNGYTVTYYVGQKDISVGNYPLAIDPYTAEELAQKWNCWLPSAKIISDIHINAAKSNTALNPGLLSSTGYKDPVTGQFYDARQVVQSRISHHTAALEAARRVEKALESMDPGSEDKVTVTNGKIIIAPTGDSRDTMDRAGRFSRVYFKGIPTKVVKKPSGEVEVQFSQAGTGASPHSTSTENPYTEYCTYTRLVDDRVDVTKPDGSKYTTTYAEAMQNKNTYSAFADTPTKPRTYIPRNTAPVQPQESLPQTIASVLDKSKKYELLAISSLKEI